MYCNGPHKKSIDKFRGTYTHIQDFRKVMGQRVKVD